MGYSIAKQKQCYIVSLCSVSGEVIGAPDRQVFHPLHLTHTRIHPRATVKSFVLFVPRLLVNFIACKSFYAYLSCCVFAVCTPDTSIILQSCIFD